MSPTWLPGTSSSEKREILEEAGSALVVALEEIGRELGAKAQWRWKLIWECDHEECDKTTGERGANGWITSKAEDLDFCSQAHLDDDQHRGGDRNGVRTGL